MTTPLSELQASPPPRNPELADRLARKLVPTWGFVTYGILYFTFFGLWIPLLSFIGTVWLLSKIFGFGHAKPIDGLGWLILLVATLLGLALGVWPFARWARGKRGPARRLLESGVLVAATVEETRQVTVNGAATTLEEVSFESDGVEHRASLSYAGTPTRGAGETRPFLVAAGVSLAAAFGSGGQLIAGRIKGGRALPVPGANEQPSFLALPFAVRAFLSLAFLVGFYALALALSTLLVAVPYLDVVKMHRFDAKIILASLAGAFAIVRALFLVKPAAFHPPGPTLLEADEPELFALIRDVAGQMKTSMPVHVYLIPDVNAFVAEIGGFLGFGTTRVMGIGLGLLAVDDVSSLKATVAHEFGHFTGGDTVLGGVVYRTRASIGRVLESLGSGFLAKPFEWYGHLYLKVTFAVSRHQELEADRAGIVLAGRDAHVEGLEREARGAVGFSVFMQSEIAPLCAAGLCPRPLYEGFTTFMQSAPLDRIDAAIASQGPDPHDTHPTLAARVAYAKTIEDPKVLRDTRPAISLLRRPLDAETALEPYLFGKLGVTGALQRIGWSEVATSYYAPRVAEEARQCAERLFPVLGAGPSFANVARAVIDALEAQPAKAASLALAIEPRVSELPPARQAEMTPKVVGRGLGVLLGAALAERGGIWKTAAGAPLSVELEGATHTPLVAGVEAAEGRGFAAVRGML